MNFIDCCIEENMVNTALRLLKKVKSEPEKQDRLNKCYNFLSNNFSTCLEIGDTLTIYRSSYGCLSDGSTDKCSIIRLKDGYKLMNHNKINHNNGKNLESFAIDTLISDDFYKRVIDFEFLLIENCFLFDLYLCGHFYTCFPSFVGLFFYRSR